MPDRHCLALAEATTAKDSAQFLQAVNAAITVVSTLRRQGVSWDRYGDFLLSLGPPLTRHMLALARGEWVAPPKKRKRR